MRVAVFTDDDFETMNGTTTALAAVLRWAPPDLAPRIYTTSALGVDQPDYLALAATGLAVPFGMDGRLYWPPRRALEQRLRQDGAELVHLTTPGPLGLTAVHLARRCGLPVIGSVHVDLEAQAATRSGSPRLGRWVGRYLRWLYARCRTVLVPSEAARMHLVERGLSSERLAVWPHGVDTEMFRPDRRSTRLRDDWRVSDRRPALLYVGRLTRERGVLALPPISDDLRSAGVDHRVVVVGEGPLRRSLASELPDAVFLAALGRDQLATVYASADLLLSTTESDTSGTVVLEAQASGVPVVASSRGAGGEDLSPNTTGFVCDRPAAWRMALGSLLRHADARQTMGLEARRFALGRRWSLTLDPLFRAYREAGLPGDIERLKIDNRVTVG